MPVSNDNVANGNCSRRIACDLNHEFIAGIGRSVHSRQLATPSVPAFSSILTTATRHDISPVVNPTPNLNIVLYQPEIPQNTGNVGRSCLAAGARLWLVRPLGFQLDASKLHRAGLDYWKHLDCSVVNDWESLCEELSPKQHWYFTKAATTVYTDVEFKPGDSLVFGCETAGLPSSLTADHSHRCLRIPIQPPVRSLNLASAVAAATFEVLRQWRVDGLIPPDFPVQ